MGGYSDPDKPQSWVADLFDKVGPTKFVLIALAAVAWIVAYVWLKDKLDWPDNYGFECHGKGCMIADAWHSPVLLRHRNPYELGLFVCIWVPIAVIVSPLVYAGVRKLRGTKLSLYSDAE